MTSKVSVPAGASVAERSHAESVELTVIERGAAASDSPPPSSPEDGVFSVHAARAGRVSSAAISRVRTHRSFVSVECGRA